MWGSLGNVVDVAAGFGIQRSVVLVLSETVLVLVIESRHLIQNASSTTNGLTTIAFRSITSTFLKEFSLSVKFFWVVFELRA